MGDWHTINSAERLTAVPSLSPLPWPGRDEGSQDMWQEGVKAAGRGGACCSGLRFDTVLAAKLVIGLLWVVFGCSDLGQIARQGGIIFLCVPGSPGPFVCTA